MQTTIDSLPENIKSLIKLAAEAQANAYAPYSHYKVGAAVLDENDRVHQGCNVENAAYTGTHAEAGAIANMIVSAGKQIKALACVTDNGGACCGDCRQRIWEFCHGDKTIKIYSSDSNFNIAVFEIGQLLPSAFEL